MTTKTKSPTLRTPTSLRADLAASLIALAERQRAGMSAGHHLLKVDIRTDQQKFISRRKWLS